MALGQVRENAKTTFEGSYYLQGFEVIPASGKYESYAQYQLGTDDGRSLAFTGWAESGADLLEKNQKYLFRFSYDPRYKNARPKVIGVTNMSSFNDLVL